MYNAPISARAHGYHRVLQCVKRRRYSTRHVGPHRSGGSKEELYPDPPLMGTDAKDKAIVEMWEKRANEEGILPASELFRNTQPAHWPFKPDGDA